jgi:flagellar protein FliO/FliZ
MDGQIWLMLIKIVIFLPFVLLLIYISARFGGSKLQSLQNGKYIKVLERVPLTKDSSLVVTKIGEKGYVLSSSSGKVEILTQISNEELLKVEDSAINPIPQFISVKEFVVKKLKLKREEQNE